MYKFVGARNFNAENLLEYFCTDPFCVTTYNYGNSPVRALRQRMQLMTPNEILLTVESCHNASEHYYEWRDDGFKQAYYRELREVIPIVAVEVLHERLHNIMILNNGSGVGHPSHSRILQ